MIFMKRRNPVFNIYKTRIINDKNFLDLEVAVPTASDAEKCFNRYFLGAECVLQGAADGSVYDLYGALITVSDTRYDGRAPGRVKVIGHGLHHLK